MSVQSNTMSQIAGLKFTTVLRVYGSGLENFHLQFLRKAFDPQMSESLHAIHRLMLESQTVKYLACFNNTLETTWRKCKSNWVGPQIKVPACDYEEV